MTVSFLLVLILKFHVLKAYNCVQRMILVMLQGKLSQQPFHELNSRLILTSHFFHKKGKAIFFLFFLSFFFWVEGRMRFPCSWVGR